MKTSSGEQDKTFYLSAEDLRIEEAETLTESEFSV